jgi:hypothetical protein
MGNVVNTRSGVGGENVVDFIELRVVKGVATGNGTRTKYVHGARASRTGFVGWSLWD